MKQSSLSIAMDKAVKLKLEAIDKAVSVLIEPISNVGNPEQLIGKPFETWTPEDLQNLVNIYGEQNDSILSRFIFRKKYEQVLALEKGEGR